MSLRANRTATPVIVLPLTRYSAYMCTGWSFCRWSQNALGDGCNKVSDELKLLVRRVTEKRGI